MRSRRYISTSGTGSEVGFDGVVAVASVFSVLESTSIARSVAGAGGRHESKLDLTAESSQELYITSQEKQKGDVHTCWIVLLYGIPQNFAVNAFPECGE